MILHELNFNPLNAKITKWSNTLKQFVGNLSTNCLSVFDHFVGLGLKGLTRVRVVIFNSLEVIFNNSFVGRVCKNVFSRDVQSFTERLDMLLFSPKPCCRGAR